MSTNVLESARKIASEQEAARQAEQAELLKQARRYAIAVATETDVPDPSEIIQLVNRLNATLNWFEDTVARCHCRMDDVAGQVKIPGKKKRAEQLEAEAAKLITESEAAKKVFDLAHYDVKNLGDGTFSPWRSDATPDDLKACRDAHRVWTDLCDRVWLAQRDAAELRKEITDLSKVDQSLIDQECGEPSPHNFKLPP